MKQPHSISSYESDDDLIDTYFESFHEENDMLLPRSQAKKLSKTSNPQEDNESSVHFRNGRKQRLKVGTMSYFYILLSYIQLSKLRFR